MFSIPAFTDSQLLQRALTHRSYVNEHPEADHNERLEFLGDAVLNFLSGEFLYKRYPDEPEGKLTSLRAALVDEQQLAKFALLLNLGSQLRLGKGAELEGGRHNTNLLSSAFEALVGAYFLDQDSSINAARAYVEPFFVSVVGTLAVSASVINYKSRFQEWTLANTGKNPIYVAIAQTGPDHAKQFTVEVRVEGEIYGRGTGRKKQDAEKDAARDALDKLGFL